MMFDQNVINLTVVHPWMQFEDAWLLMKWSYEKNRSQDKYCGIQTVKTLMSIDFGIYQRQSEEWLRNLIREAKIKFGYK